MSAGARLASAQLTPALRRVADLLLDAEDLEFTPADRAELQKSLDAYRAGDLPAAFAAYPGSPEPGEPGTDAGRIYLAELLLSAGQVDGAENLLRKLGTNSSPAEALRWIIAAVRGNVDRPPEVHTSASEWLGLSYYYQARHELPQALNAARHADPSVIKIDNEKAVKWLRNGAQPTETVEKLLKTSGAWEWFKSGNEPAPAAEAGETSAS